MSVSLDETTTNYGGEGDILLQSLTPWGGLFIGNLNDMGGSLCNQTCYIQEIYGGSKCMHTNGKLEKELVYLY